MNLTRKQYQMSTFKLEYLLDEDTKQIAMILIPSGKESCYAERREWLQIPEMVRLDMDKRAWEVWCICLLTDIRREKVPERHLNMGRQQSSYYSESSIKKQSLACKKL